MSVAMFESLQLPCDARVIDISGRAHSVAAALRPLGYAHVTAVGEMEAPPDPKEDAAPSGPLGRLAQVPPLRYDLWHDHTVLSAVDSLDVLQEYHRTLLRALRPGAHVILAIPAPADRREESQAPFAPSHLRGLIDFLGPEFAVRSVRLHDHAQPGGPAARFLYVLAAYLPAL